MKVLGDIRHSILATDLALFFTNHARLKEVVTKTGFSWNSPEQRYELDTHSAKHVQSSQQTHNTQSTPGSPPQLMQSSQQAHNTQSTPGSPPQLMPRPCSCWYCTSTNVLCEQLESVLSTEEGESD